MATELSEHVLNFWSEAFKSSPAAYESLVGAAKRSPYFASQMTAFAERPNAKVTLGEGGFAVGGQF